MSYKLELKIPGLPKMSNQSLRGHWRVKFAHTKKWKSLVSKAIGISKPMEPLSYAKLTLIRHSSRRPDYDGLVSSFKPIIDSLTENGIIKDDTFEVIGIPEYLWIKASPKCGSIEIRVKELTKSLENSITL